MIDWALPWAFVILPLPLLVNRLLPPMRQRDHALRVPFFRQLTNAAGVDVRAAASVVERSRWVMLSASVVWILVVVALAGPARLGPPQEITRSKRDVVLAIDISGSMDTKDFPASDGTRQQRFAAVQVVVDQFVQSRQGDRVALIIFGSNAYVQAPLTEDLATVAALLAQTEVGMAGPHTALGDAIGLAIKTFEASDIEQRMLILLSDGNDTASRMSPLNAAEIARDKGVRLFAIGVGDPKASGEDKLDMALLGDLAQRTGGQSYFAGDSAALGAVYTEIDALNPRDVETLSWRPRTDLFFIPLGLAVLLAGATWLLAGARNMRRRQV